MFNKNNQNIDIDVNHSEMCNMNDKVRGKKINTDDIKIFF